MGLYGENKRIKKTKPTIKKSTPDLVYNESLTFKVPRKKIEVYINLHPFVLFHYFTTQKRTKGLYYKFCFMCVFWNMVNTLIIRYSQICIKSSLLGHQKSGLIRQMTSLKRFNSYDTFYDRTRKGWPFNTGDRMGRFDCILFHLFEELAGVPSKIINNILDGWEISPFRLMIPFSEFECLLEIRS